MHLVTSGIARRSRHKRSCGQSWRCMKSMLYNYREPMVAIVAAIMLETPSPCVIFSSFILVCALGSGLTTGR